MQKLYILEKCKFYVSPSIYVNLECKFFQKCKSMENVNLQFSQTRGNVECLKTLGAKHSLCQIKGTKLLRRFLAIVGYRGNGFIMCACMKLTEFW